MIASLERRHDHHRVGNDHEAVANWQINAVEIALDQCQALSQAL